MRLLPVLLAFVLASGCTVGVPCSFVQASRKFADRVLPDYERLLAADESTSPELKALRLELIAEWRAALEDAEGLCTTSLATEPVVEPVGE